MSMNREPPIQDELDVAKTYLVEVLQRHERLMVAYSGGVDSTFLLKMSLQVLGSDRVLAVLGVSASLAVSEHQEAEAYAKSMGASLRLLETHELANENYASNPSNRCYFCKSELYERMRPLADELGFAAIADGTNLDDAVDYRPGRQAALEHGVVSPLLEAGFSKEMIRQESKRLGLRSWDKPEMPCLASRIPYGDRVDSDKLKQIERAEACLRGLGIRAARVRHHGEIARLELQEADLNRALEKRDELLDSIRRCGFRYVTLDLEGYRKGRLNDALTPGTLRGIRSSG